ncbi:haloalkane dehalogenase [Parahalioglobus pacificus]|uniref:Haloalkane dehalogenase n=1 Tax=Parahalioglobus pacificus TaxID=930806 RepID=A0A918XEA9_9GAMM|nr:haloalkane dehalogenase [Halioglobus pacificus]GHD28256.1 haloalkane dehalogenase [Halioglobus pacificus]
MSTDHRFPKKVAQVLGRSVAYIEEGEGDPIVLLHGNPTSSYLWRNVIPGLMGSGRVIVPDLIGQGDSEKLPEAEAAQGYTFELAYNHVEGLLVELGATSNVTLVIHDWGSAIGFHWARMHPDAVRGIAYMEGIVRPVEWEQWPEAAQGIFKGFRSEKGEDLILNRNMFIEAVLPTSIMRTLSEEEMNAYRAPFLRPEDRYPTLNWPRQIPISGEPPHMVELVQAYADFMTQAPFPKLFINAEPGSILVGEQREFCRSWPNQQEVTVKGLHFIQEDSGPEIGAAVADWLADI